MPWTKILHKICFSGLHWTGLSIETCENWVFGASIKMSILVLNFSTESEKELTLYDTCSLLQFILLTMTINIPLKWKISTTTVTFSRLGTHFDGRPKRLTYREISPNIFLLTNCTRKKTVSQADLRTSDTDRVKWLQQLLRIVMI